jgi:hypothetical protein
LIRNFATQSGTRSFGTLATLPLADAAAPLIRLFIAPICRSKALVAPLEYE